MMIRIVLVLYLISLSYSIYINKSNNRLSQCKRLSKNNKLYNSNSCVIVSLEEEKVEELKKVRDGLDKEFVNVALPAFVALAADPLASLVDAYFVGRLGAAEQAGMGIAISAQYSIAKLYNDPLLKSSTSLVANKSGDELSASVSTAITTAMAIGLLQCIMFLFFTEPIMNFMGVSTTSDMFSSALGYMKWRAIGVPAATVLLVSNGIFRGRGDTKTPLYCTVAGNLVNIILDPIFIFTLKMGCAGAGAATAISQWCTAIPLLYFLNKSIPFNISGGKDGVLKSAYSSYAKAGSLLLLRTVAKISAYTVTASAAARLGTIPMAAYSLTFNLGFATSQLCESISVATQALIARDMPLNTWKKRYAAGHVMNRSLLAGILVSSALTIFTLLNQDNVLGGLTTSVEIRNAAAAIMPVVLATQIFKGLAYSTGGILLGGFDWLWSTAGMVASAIVCVALTTFLQPSSIWNIWVALAAFMATQVVTASLRFFSNKGPWIGVNVFK